MQYNQFGRLPTNEEMKVDLESGFAMLVNFVNTERVTQEMQLHEKASANVEPMEEESIPEGNDDLIDLDDV